MSKQLTLSATLSLAAMALFALVAAPDRPVSQSGATTEAAAPAFQAALPKP